MQQLEINAYTVKYSLCTSKLKLKSNEVTVEGQTVITIRQETSSKKMDSIFHYSSLISKLPDVLVKVSLFSFILLQKDFSSAEVYITTLIFTSYRI